MQFTQKAYTHSPEPQRCDRTAMNVGAVIGGSTTTHTTHSLFRQPRCRHRLEGFFVSAFRHRQLAATVGLGACLALSVAAAPASFATPPGNNGTLKIHELGTPSGTENNDPKVCKFNLEAFGLDAGQGGTIEILPQGQDSDTTDELTVEFPTADDEGYGDTVYINDDSNGEDDGLELANGHYKATLYGKFGDLDSEKAKSKVFKVECEDEPTPTTTSTTSEPSGSSSSEPSGSTSEPSGSTSEPSGSTSEPTGSTSEPTGTTTVTGPPVETDLLSDGGSNVTAVAVGLGVTGLVVGAGVAMRRRIKD